MSSEPEGHYLPEKHKLLNKFDKTAKKVRGVFVSRYGEAMADTLILDARYEFKKIIPEIPYVDGPPALNVFFRMTAMEVALYKAMKGYGKGPAEAWGVCHAAIRIWAEGIPGYVKFFIRFSMFSPITKFRARRISKKTLKKPMGGFVLKYVEGDGEAFDWGVDYLACSILKFVEKQGVSEFAPYVCMSDVPMSDVMGWGLIRSETLADGCVRCDFRFKKGGLTMVSSRTNDVHATIEGLKSRMGFDIGEH